MSHRAEPVLESQPALRRATLARLAVAALALAGVFAPLTGCSSTERDRYYSSRSVVIPAQAGDGRTTLAAWPYGQPSQPAATARAGSLSDLPQ